MKYTLVTYFALLLITLSADSILQTGQEKTHQGTAVPITQVGSKRSGPRTSFASYSAIGEPLQVLVRDVEAWRKMWEQIHRTVSPLPPLPDIDFSREMVVVVALGARPTGGYGIIVDRAYERDDRLEIVVRKQTPGKTCFNTQAVTQPVDIVRLPKTERSVVFRETEVVHDCK